MATETQENVTSFSDQLLAEAGATTPATTDPQPDTPKQPPQVSTEIPLVTPSSNGQEQPPKPAAEKKADATDGEGAEAEIDDTRLMAALSKKMGREIKSFDDLTPKATPELTDEEKKTLSEQNRSQAIEYGKKNNFFTQSQYDNYVTFSALSPTEVVQARFVAKEMETEGVDLEEATDTFNEFYHTMEAEDTPKYKRAQALIKKEYEEIKRAEFSKIVDVEQDFETYKKDEHRATIFKTEVEKIFDNLPPKFEFKIDGETLSFPINLKDKKTLDIITGLKTEYLNVEMMNSTTDQTGKVDQAGLAGVITKDLQNALLESVVTAVAKSYADIKVQKAKMGRRGVIDLEEETATTSTAGKDGVPMGLSDSMLKEAGYDLPSKSN